MYESLPQKASTYRGRILISREIRDELPLGREEVSAVRLRSVRSGSVSVRFGAAQFGSGWFGLVRVGSIRLGSVQFGSSSINSNVPFNAIQFRCIRKSGGEVTTAAQIIDHRARSALHPPSPVLTLRFSPSLSLSLFIRRCHTYMCKKNIRLTSGS